MTNPITGPDQMYDADYLRRIIKTEAARPIIESKRSLELVDYTLFGNWLKNANLPDTIFHKNLTLEDLMSQCGFINSQLPQVKINSQFTAQITNFLSEQHLTSSADIIFVFASKSITRKQKAVELWRKKIAPTIFVAGGHPFYQSNEESESVVYRDWAISQGIPKESIFIEPNCVSIADNIRRGLNTLDRLNINFKKMIFVTAWYNQKRAWMMLEKYLDLSQASFFQSADIDPSNDISPSRWFQNEFGQKIIINEFLKMRIHDYLVFNRIV